MDHREIHVEILVGRAVVDVAGRRVGRLEEITIEREGDECVVKEYLIDGYGALERFAGWAIARAILHMLPFVAARRRRVRWHLMDFADPTRPRVMVALAELGQSVGRAA